MNMIYASFKNNFLARGKHSQSPLMLNGRYLNLVTYLLLYKIRIENKLFDN